LDAHSTVRTLDAPDIVIDIFEKEGFIWGGKWTVWDNMHFEYRPELILGRELVRP